MQIQRRIIAAPGPGEPPVKTKILVVDDDPQIRDVVRIAIESAGHSVVLAADGAEALAVFGREVPALVILDIGLPEMDGREVCRRIRRGQGPAAETPVIFLTAEGCEIDRVVGLELGADDYVVKPFSPRELVARIGAVLKRAATSPARPEADTMRHGALSLSTARHECRLSGRPVLLTAREMELLARLMAHPAQVISRPQLVDAIYGTNVHVSDRTMDSHLRNLRAKLGAEGCEDAIDTVHGVGIRMGACTDIRA